MSIESTPLPLIAVTMGDGAGVGPEVIVPALLDGETRKRCRPVVVGDAKRLRLAATVLGIDVDVVAIEEWPGMAAALAAADPGELFDWPLLAKAGIGLFPFEARPMVGSGQQVGDKGLKEGQVEYQHRRDAESSKVAAADVVQHIRARLSV